MKKSIPFFSLILICNIICAQQLTHVLGDVLIQSTSEKNIITIIAKNQRFNNEPTKLRLVRRLAPELDIWLLHFDPNKTHEQHFLSHLKRQQLVTVAQFNHLVQMRQNIPNDPQFQQQWHWQNTGANNGLAGADVDAPLAWDITTGGLTPNGDQIVVAVLDDGTDLNHPDLMDNHWVNSNEIPGNGVDDDNNGYIDDYNGWSIITNNDAVGNGNHGVQVSGMIGAAGNNSTGGCGINWDVKIMMVKNNFDTEESRVLEAYAYPLTMRRMYNQTNGAKGAYVVATNASWGIDFGDPEDAPLWCAFYDTLGMAGILNCGATSNQSINIDIEGDLPTACPSDFMVAVTRSGNTDNQGGGFGPMQIDLAAPGINVFTSTTGGGYGSTTGTSFASPLVAGIIGLLYSAPCSNLDQLAKTNPAAAALLVRQYLLEGVDIIPGYQNLVATSGRANAYKSLLLLMEDCGPCPTPAALQTTNIIDTTATLSWIPGDSTVSVNLRWRMLGTAIWNVKSDAISPYQLNNLVACSEYEWQVEAICADTMSGFTNSVVFKTDGCCEPPADLSIAEIFEDGATAIWSDLLAANSYNIRISLLGQANFSTFNTQNPTYQFSGLENCSTYEVQIQTVCDTGSTIFSESVVFSTFGCGACTDSTYCVSAGADSGSEWIQHVVVHSIDNISGDDGGYGDYTGNTAELIAGITYPISLTPGFSGSSFLEQFTVWIDYNLDGDFDDIGEQVYNPNASTSMVMGTILIPEWVSNGITRMRVTMQFNQESLPCESFDFGEVEDYCVLLSGGNGCPPPTLTVDVVSNEEVVFDTEIPDFSYESLEWRYREFGTINWIGPEPLMTGMMTVSNLFSKCTNYEVQARSVCSSSVSSPWGESLMFQTLGCGACIDKSYCQTGGISANFEYIESVQINQINNISGNDNGYGNFTSSAQTTFLSTNRQYTIMLTPEFPSGPFDVFFNVWIDFNQDGDFKDNDEKVFTSLATTTAVTGMVSVPSNALEGATRLRISMSESDAANDCDVFTFGESEDYCVTIIQGDEPCLSPVLQVNDTTATTATVNWGGSGVSIGYNLRIKAVANSDWIEVSENTLSHTFNQLQPCTDYEVQIRTVCADEISPYSASLLFKTSCSVATSDLLPADIFAYRMYPNPFQNGFSCDLEMANASIVSFTMLDVNGRKVFQEKRRLSVGKHYIDFKNISQIPAGIYMMELKSDAGIFTKKIIKLH